MATKVWLAALAALAVALLIKIHVFLYQVLTRNNDDNASKDNIRLTLSTTSSNKNNNMNNIDGVDAATIQKLLDNHNIDADDTNSKMTLEEAHSHKLTPLVGNSNIDTSHYTIRMNTWHRNEQLLLSINHHAKCTGVAEIQIIWCDTINDPPDNILHHSSGKVKIERHDVNSLNERFKIVLDTPTLGILSLDDDVDGLDREDLELLEARVDYFMNMTINHCSMKIMHQLLNIELAFLSVIVISPQIDI